MQGGEDPALSHPTTENLNALLEHCQYEVVRGGAVGWGAAVGRWGGGGSGAVCGVGRGGAVRGGAVLGLVRFCSSYFVSLRNLYFAPACAPSPAPSTPFTHL